MGRLTLNNSLSLSQLLLAILNWKEDHVDNEVLAGDKDGKGNGQSMITDHHRFKYDQPWYLYTKS